MLRRYPFRIVLHFIVTTVGIVITSIFAGGFPDDLPTRIVRNRQHRHSKSAILQDIFIAVTVLTMVTIFCRDILDGVFAAHRTL